MAPAIPSSSRFSHSSFRNMSKSSRNLKVSEEASDDDDPYNDRDYSPAGVGRRKPRLITIKYAPKAVADWCSIAVIRKTALIAVKKSVVKEDALGHLLAIGWKFFYTPKKNKQELRYKSPDGRVYISLRTACKACIDEGGAADLPPPTPPDTDPPVVEVKKAPSSLKKPKSPVQNCGKKITVLPTAAKGSSRRKAGLSQLMEQGLVSPGDRVYYNITAKSDDPLMAWGLITNEGVIKCDCCSKGFSISNFEAHTGSTKRRPAANIFLEDGRSLLDCQKQLNQNQKNQTKKAIEKVNINNNARSSDTLCLDKNDSICSLCHFGGELILCDLCPAAFHGSCLGFKQVPIGDWFCPSCSCKICGQVSYDFDFDNGVISSSSSDSSFVKCVQCEQNVHIGCVKSVQVLEDDHDDSNQIINKENWFCTKRCKDIHMGLQSLLWKQIPVGLEENNLTFTLLKHSPNSTMSENDQRKKFNSALAVMHESFRPVKDPITKSNIIEDVVFSRRSESKRLNFEGFYTVILERKNTVATVATVRVYGEEVAEVPFVATRLKHRRQGLCRSLMKELEHQLMKLGVKRLTLPSVPEALNSWTGGFGFSKMRDSDILELVKFTFLGFQHTVRCQKELVEKFRIPNDLEWRPRKRLKQTVNLEDEINTDSMSFDDWSSFSDAFD